MNHLKVRSGLIDGEIVCYDERGLATFQLLRHRRNEPQAFLYAFDLLELNGTDLRREPILISKTKRGSTREREALPICESYVILVEMSSTLRGYPQAATCRDASA